MASTLPLSIPLSICASIYCRILHSPTHERKNKIPMSVSSAQGIYCILLYRQVGNCESAFSAHFYSRFAVSLPTPPLLLTRLIEQLTHAGSAVSRGGPSSASQFFSPLSHMKGNQNCPPLFGVFLSPSSIAFCTRNVRKRKGLQQESFLGFFPFSVMGNLRIAIFAFFVFFLHSSLPLPLPGFTPCRISNPLPIKIH